MDLMTKSDDGTLTVDHALSRWLELLGEAMVKLGRPFQDMMSLKEIMADVRKDLNDKAIHAYWPMYALVFPAFSIC